MDDFWNRLQELEQHLDQLEQGDVRHRDRLAGLSRELGGLNRTASRLQGVLSTVAAAGFGGECPVRGSGTWGWPCCDAGDSGDMGGYGDPQNRGTLGTRRGSGVVGDLGDTVGL